MFLLTFVTVLAVVTAASAGGPAGTGADAQNGGTLLVLVTDYDTEFNSRTLELRELGVDREFARPVLRDLPYGYGIQFARNRRSFAYITRGTLVIVRIEGGARTVVARGVSHFAWDQRGERFAYVSTGKVPQIFVVRSDGTARRRLTANTRRRTNTFSPYNAVASSSNGARIAFSHQSSNHHRPLGGSVYTMTSAGKGATRVRGLSGFVPSQLTWSPKDRRLAVGGIVNSGILLVDRGRVTVARGTGCCTGVSAVWSPDASRIAFYGGDYTQTEAGGVANLEARRATVFHQFDGRVHAPAWSPDSLRLAFVACADAECGLYVANREGRDLRSIGNPEPNDVEAVAWSG